MGSLGAGSGGGELTEPLQRGVAGVVVPAATPLFILFAASIFEMTAASVMCSDISNVYHDGCPGIVGYAVAVGTVSAAGCSRMGACGAGAWMTMARPRRLQRASSGR